MKIRFALLLCLALAACAAPTPTAPLTVYAASSLTDAFREIGAAYEKQFPGARVEFNFAGSQELASQIQNGARADVFASADTRAMDALVSSHPVARDSGTPRAFARNELAMIIPSGNPARLERAQDLNRQGLKIVIAAESVPVGEYTRQLIENFRHDAAFGPDFPALFYGNVVSQETNVRQVLTKVALGEADVGIVYLTDARTMPEQVTVLPMPEGLNVTAEYPIAVLDTQNKTQAKQFTDFVLSPQGRAVLTQYGFLPPN